VIAIATTLAATSGGMAGASPEVDLGQESSWPSTSTPTTTTPSSTGVRTAPLAPIRGADRISVPVAAPPSAFESVETRPEREPGKAAKRSSRDLIREQQEALTVPVDRLPELPAGAVPRSEREPVPSGFSKEEADLSERMTLALAADWQLYWPSPHAVCGEIRNKYNAMGGPGSWLNFPTSPEYQNPGNTGARSEFINGSIYWSPPTGAHPVTLLFMSKWQHYGWEAGWMGYPTTDETPNGDNRGSRQEFQGAAIYWHSNPIPTLAVIGGAIRTEWNAQGAHSGVLGYPTSDELEDDGERYNRFENGMIFWSASLGTSTIKNEGRVYQAASDCHISTYQDCTPGSNPYLNMERCLKRNAADPSKDMDAGVVIWVLNGRFAYGEVGMTCGRYRHINNRHNAGADVRNFIGCMMLIYARGVPWDGADSPNIGIKWKNTKSGVWGYNSVNPFSTPMSYTTAFTSGDGADWGGCARGQTTG
jgi:hypothetical protein